MKNALESTNHNEGNRNTDPPIDVTPNPEFLIKSIAEQGYSIESALADLIDNSISADAGHIDVLINPDQEPFQLFIADDGRGMDANRLEKCMHFPSASMETDRPVGDLGRFGLGMKTASFSQTRRFTVLSRAKGTQKFRGLTWDVKHLKTGRWEIIENTEEEIDLLIRNYQTLAAGFNGAKAGFLPNTIILWDGLYKFEEFLVNSRLKSDTLKNAISETVIDHLSIVFHRFMERKTGRLTIRVNNRNVVPFNPFPEDQPDLRSIDSRQASLKEDVVKLEGFVLPSRSVGESKEYGSVWTTSTKGLMDLEGIYVYRADRIIVFGGWNEITRKTPVLRLARLRVEVGNKVDTLFHLNVAKSKIIIPFDIRTTFIRYVAELKEQAEKEYYNRGIRHFAKKGQTANHSLFEKHATDKGIMLEVNKEFPLLSSLRSELNKDQNARLSFILKMATTVINNTRKVHESVPIQEIEEDTGLSQSELIECIHRLKASGIPHEYIKTTLLKELGYDVKALSAEIADLLK